MSRHRSPLTRAALGISLLAATACATTGATFRSGVGDSFPDRPPYRAGGTAAAGSRIAVLPVAYQRGASPADLLDPASAPASPVSALLGEMNAYVDSLVRATGGAGAVRLAGQPGTPPDVRFGCVPDATGDCASPDDAGPAVRSSSTEQPRMLLAVGRPSPEWTAATGTALEREGARHALVLTLEVGQYWVTKTGWANRKSIELGTGYSVPLPWLTSLDAPVSVVQLTGALMDRTGQAVAIGAEGLLARRTSLVMSGLGAQRVIGDGDVEQLRRERRTDLPGQPLVWQVALRQLVSDLTK